MEVKPALACLKMGLLHMLLWIRDLSQSKQDYYSTLFILVASILVSQIEDAVSVKYLGKQTCNKTIKNHANYKFKIWTKKV